MPLALLDHPVLAARYFFPRPDRLPSRVRVDVEVEGATLCCARFPAPPGGLVVLHFHGNGEAAADWADGFPSWLAARGHGLFLAEYRGYGGSTGEPLLGRLLSDAGALVAAAGAPPGRIVLFGRSVGSLLALEAAARFPGAAGLVLESAIADPLERLLLRVDPAELGVTEEDFAAGVSARLDHRAKIAAYGGPVLVLHAEHDGLVDVSHGRRLAAWAGARATLRTFPRGDHNSVLAENEAEYLGALEEFLARLA